MFKKINTYYYVITSLILSVRIHTLGNTHILGAISIVFA
jgi:hypothetical protein